MTNKELIDQLRSKFGDEILDISELPNSYKGENIKAILLGADSTNNGLKGEGLIKLQTVFGIGEYDIFFRSQLANIRAVGLNQNNLFVQNVCRNYFKNETSKNKIWSDVSVNWLPILKNELDSIDLERKLPVFATSEVILKVLVDNLPKASTIYSDCISFFPSKLERKVFAFYRHPRYSLSSERNGKYKKFLIKKLMQYELK